MSTDLGVVFSATGNGSGTYVDKYGATRANATLANASWVGMNVGAIPTALVEAGGHGSLTGFVYFNKAGGGVASVDVRLRQKYGGADANVSGGYCAVTFYDNESAADGNSANYAASGRFRIDTTNVRNGGGLIVEVWANGVPAAGDAVKVALVAGGAL